MGLSSITQPLYLSALGHDSATVGFLIGASAIISVLVLLPAGLVADRYGRRSILILSVLAYTLAFIIYAIASHFMGLLLSSVLIGVAWGTYIGPSNAILTDKTTPNGRDYVFSLYAFLSASAVIIGSLLSGVTDLATSFLHQTPLEAYRTMFWASVALNSICVPILFSVREAPIRRHEERRLVVRSLRPISVLGLANGLLGFGAGAFIPLLPVYLSSKFSATETEIGILLALSNGAMALANILAPKLSERIGQVGMITLTQGMSVIPLVLIPFSQTFYEVEFLYVTRTALMNMSSPIFNAYTMSIVAKDERASVSSVMAMAWNGADAAGTTASGILMGLRLDGPIYVGALFYALSTVLFYAYFRKRPKPTD